MGATVNLKARSLQALWLSPAGWLKGLLFTGPDQSQRGGPWGSRSKTATGFCLVGGALQVCDGDEKRAGILIRKLGLRLKRQFPMRTKRYSSEWDVVVAFNNDPFTSFANIQELIKGVRTPPKSK